MKNLQDHRYLRLFTLAALYFAQGVPWGFVATGYVVFMADQGLDNLEVSKAVALAYLPWSFKLIWGPLLDRYPAGRFGRRRPFIVLAEFLMGLTLLVLMTVDPVAHLSWVGVILFLHNTFASVQDVAVDALAVDILPREERGSANSLMWASKYGGVAVGGGGGLQLAAYSGWPSLFLVMAFIIWGIMLLPLLFPERPPATSAQAPAAGERLTFRKLWQSFAFKAPLVGIAIAFLTPFGYALVGTFTTRMFRADLHLSDAAIGTLSGVVDPISGVVGALIGGVLADRFGARRMIGVFMVGIALSLAVFGAASPLWPHFKFLLVYTAIVSAFISAYNAAALGFFMGLSNPAIGATHFAVYMAAGNLCYAVTTPLGGWAADRFGYVPTYLGAAVIQLLTIGLLPFCNPAVAEARFRFNQPKRVPP